MNPVLKMFGSAGFHSNSYLRIAITKEAENIRETSWTVFPEPRSKSGERKTLLLKWIPNTSGNDTIFAFGKIKKKREAIPNGFNMRGPPSFINVSVCVCYQSFLTLKKSIYISRKLARTRFRIAARIKWWMAAHLLGYKSAWQLQENVACVRCGTETRCDEVRLRTHENTIFRILFPSRDVLTRFSDFSHWMVKATHMRMNVTWLIAKNGGYVIKDYW